MNIFLLDFNPRKAAEYHCDKHVVKMILETAQLLYTAHWMLNPEVLPAESYKKTHVNHPCAIWVRESLSNYIWLAELGKCLCAEYTHRYHKLHKTAIHIEWLQSHLPNLSDIGITLIRQAMPKECKHPNPVEAYRTYYLEYKSHFLVYTSREVPAFAASVGRISRSSKSTLHSAE
jgi:hypothetical protein